MRYLRPIGDDTRHGDYGYLGADYPVPEGWELVEGEPPEGSVFTRPVPEQLSALDQLKAMFTSLPVEAQAQFGPVAAAVFMFLDQNNPEAARLVILNTAVPDELTELKNNMLAVFDG